MFTVVYYDKKGRVSQEDYDDLYNAIEDGESTLRFDPVVEKKQLIKVEITSKKWSESNRVMRCSIIGKEKEKDPDGEINVVEWDLVDV